MRRAIPLFLALLVLATLAWAEPDAESPARQDVPKASVRVDDGDSVAIHWPEGPEMVRILGIDTPEVQHLEHDLPFAQPFGDVAAGFLQGCLAVCDRVEILRAADKDPYGRTLAYLFLDGKNYSTLVVEASLAVANVDHYGDNGLPEPAAAVQEAAKKAGPVPFEPPHFFRRRMKKVAGWMKQQGTYPEGAADDEER